jgi:hypothetical protein
MSDTNLSLVKEKAHNILFPNAYSPYATNATWRMKQRKIAALLDEYAQHEGEPLRLKNLVALLSKVPEPLTYTPGDLIHPEAKKQAVRYYVKNERTQYHACKVFSALTLRNHIGIGQDALGGHYLQYANPRIPAAIAQASYEIYDGETSEQFIVKDRANSQYHLSPDRVSLESIFVQHGLLPKDMGMRVAYVVNNKLHPLTFADMALESRMSAADPTRYISPDLLGKSIGLTARKQNQSLSR